MGNQESIIIPDLKKGQKITVMGKTLKGNCGFSVSENATGSSGWENTTTNQTNIATVNSDGDVMISCTLEDGGSGMGITSVSVTGIDGETVLTKAQYLEEISAPTINYDPTTHEVNIVSGSSDAYGEVTTYYTLTGDDPTKTDDAYSTAFTLTESCTIKAISISNLTGKTSNVVERTTTLFKAVLDYVNEKGKFWAETIDEWNHMWIHENDNKYFIFEVQYIAEKDEGNPMVSLSVPSNPGTDWCARSLVTGTHVYIENGLQSHFIERNDSTGEYIDLRIGGTMNTRTSKGEDNEDFTPTGNTFYVKFFENKLKRAELGYSDMDATIVDRSYWPQNYPIIRLEDVMLLYAECVGNTKDGYAVLNKIRTRAGLDPLSRLSAEEFQEAVANERRYELAEEGHRWHDLVSKEQYVEAIRQMFERDDKTVDGTYRAFIPRVTKDMYLYPIPQSQIEVRAGLYKQNPGY
ncbi:MAG: RagB/SusD family nutrient uptake outer membrane protein [Prevotella sp.]|nr:RagB/SusD family nutrient uptake outer membrane protein [Prevotella sp.]